MPPPLWHSEDALHLLETALACGNVSFPPVAIVPFYLYAIVEKFPFQVMAVSQCAQDMKRRQG